ncbi:uncharacterized protein EV420DRAFT_213488 [Desarmillaria tabescens]|uniref:F-box domain-containing protein n=1 Tax=Armillaria tabescens TaxID=1929756 RepID=A0AA39TQH9_ARMTA|nr:uncharacterized protein EV420DRAFT_213488 [Desarmillaria tabescens]KAK0460514.1 hypothetical protein EV420DRAFT_213488 [Desarmillaria tabescens]
MDQSSKVPVLLRRVPTSTLSRIFTLVKEERYDVFDVSRGPWALSHVCRDWRAILLLGSLWTGLSVDQTKCSFKLKDPLSLLQTALSRLGPFHPLDFTFRTNYRCFDESQKGIVDALLLEVIQVSKQWRIATIELSPERMRTLFTVRNNTPNLQTLHLKCSDIHEFGTIDAFALSPNLSKVTLQNFGHLKNRIELPYPRLVAFSDDREWGDESMTEYYVALLRRSPKLERLLTNHQLLGPHSKKPGLFSKAKPSIITNASLRDLHACDSALMRRISLPALESLTVNSYDVTLPDDILPAIRDMLVQSKCALRTLSIFDPPGSSDLTRILEINPQLTELRLRFPSWSKKQDNTIKSLIATVVKRANSFLPQLRVLDINMYDCEFLGVGFAFISTGLLDLVKARPGLRVLNVQILTQDVLSGLSPKDVNELRAFKEQGRELSITTRGEYRKGTDDQRFTQTERLRVYV